MNKSRRNTTSNSNRPMPDVEIVVVRARAEPATRAILIDFSNCFIHRILALLLIAFKAIVSSPEFKTKAHSSILVDSVDPDPDTAPTDWTAALASKTGDLYKI